MRTCIARKAIAATRDIGIDEQANRFANDRFLKSGSASRKNCFLSVDR
jgi:hypothetical protein